MSLHGYSRLKRFLVHLLRSKSMQRLLLTISIEDRRLSSWRYYEFSSSLKTSIFPTKLITNKHLKTRTRIHYHTQKHCHTQSHSHLHWTQTPQHSHTVTHTTLTYLDTTKKHLHTTTYKNTYTHTHLSTHSHSHPHTFTHSHTYIHTDFCLTPLNKNIQKTKDFHFATVKQSRL